MCGGAAGGGVGWGGGRGGGVRWGEKNENELVGHWEYGLLEVIGNQATRFYIQYIFCVLLKNLLSLIIIT